jgi:DNA-directed RNA polymerase subunit beta
VEGEFMMVKREDIELMDISPNQLVSVSASLIPFLENDDANRALMGSNMQRQAVPLLTNEAPLVGTGIEGVVAKDSGVTILAENDGIIADVEASRIVIKHDLKPENPFEKPVSIYNLSKFIRSNQNTCFNHRPIVRKGQRVKPEKLLPMVLPPIKGNLLWGKMLLSHLCPGVDIILRIPYWSVNAW